MTQGRFVRRLLLDPVRNDSGLFNPKSKIQKHRVEAYAGAFDGKGDALRSHNAILWEQNAANTET
jgi:hypothetical protein